MSNNRLVVNGLDELRATLRSLPEELRAEAVGIVQRHAQKAVDAIVGKYPKGPSGNLKRGVKVETLANKGQFGVSVRVKNTARHAYIYENGTQARHTDLGVNRGSMPPGHVFIPIVIRERRAMEVDLRDLVTRQGMVVHG